MKPNILFNVSPFVHVLIIKNISQKRLVILKLGDDYWVFFFVDSDLFKFFYICSDCFSFQSFFALFCVSIGVVLFSGDLKGKHPSEDFQERAPQKKICCCLSDSSHLKNYFVPYPLNLYSCTAVKVLWIIRLEM